MAPAPGHGTSRGFPPRIYWDDPAVRLLMDHPSHVGLHVPCWGILTSLGGAI